MADRGRLRCALWGAALAAGLNLPEVAPWWHPACAVRDNGPSYLAWGMPLPFAEPTGYSSGEFGYLPLALVLNLAATGLFGFWLASRLLRRVDGWSAGARKAVLIAGAIVALLSWGLLMAELAMLGISTGALSDGLLSYRPWFLASLFGSPPCVS